MDNYKELIDRLRTMDPYNIDCVKAAGAIEFLISEIDKIINDPCSVCKEEKITDCYYCVHGNGDSIDCFEWRGLQKESEPDA